METDYRDMKALCNSYGHTDLRGRPVQHVDCPDGSSIECAVYTVKDMISGEMVSPREYRAVIRIEQWESGHTVTNEYLMEISDPGDFHRYMYDAFGAHDWRGAFDPGSVDARDYDGIRFRGYGELDECIAYIGCVSFHRDYPNVFHGGALAADSRWVPDLLSMGFVEDWGGYHDFVDCVKYGYCEDPDDFENPEDLADDLLERYGTTWWDGGNMHYLILANADIADDFQDGDRWNEDGTRYIPFDC